MAIELHTIRTARNKETPKGTEIILKTAREPGCVNVSIRLPGAAKWSRLGDVPVLDGVAKLPVPMLFLVHAKQDAPQVRQLSDRLWDDGFLVWMDERDLLPGDDWERKIDDAIERSDYVLVVLSPASCQKTGQVQREIRHAFRQRELRPQGQRFIIPVLLHSCNPPREFRGIHWVQLWERGAYERLCRAMR